MQVDAELSPLVQRTFTLASDLLDGPPVNGNRHVAHAHDAPEEDQEHKTVLRTEYRATTNRMLRVAVNGFMESLSVVLGVMEELDVDVLATTR